jgi:hypothetical protein
MPGEETVSGSWGSTGMAGRASGSYLSTTMGR